MGYTVETISVRAAMNLACPLSNFPYSHVEIGCLSSFYLRIKLALAGYLFF